LATVNDRLESESPCRINAPPPESEVELGKETIGELSTVTTVSEP
jgi:hypothetical protein